MFIPGAAMFRKPMRLEKWIAFDGAAFADVALEVENASDGGSADDGFDAEQGHASENAESTQYSEVDNRDDFAVDDEGGADADVYGLLARSAFFDLFAADEQISNTLFLNFQDYPEYDGGAYLTFPIGLDRPDHFDASGLRSYTPFIYDNHATFSISDEAAGTINVTDMYLGVSNPENGSFSIFNIYGKQSLHNFVTANHIPVGTTFAYTFGTIPSSGVYTIPLRIGTIVKTSWGQYGIADTEHTAVAYSYGDSVRFGFVNGATSDHVAAVINSLVYTPNGKQVEGGDSFQVSLYHDTTGNAYSYGKLIAGKGCAFVESNESGVIADATKPCDTTGAIIIDDGSGDDDGPGGDDDGDDDGPGGDDDGDDIDDSNDDDVIDPTDPNPGGTDIPGLEPDLPTIEDPVPGVDPPSEPDPYIPPPPIDAGDQGEWDADNGDWDASGEGAGPSDGDAAAEGGDGGDGTPGSSGEDAAAADGWYVPVANDEEDDDADLAEGAAVGVAAAVAEDVKESSADATVDPMFLDANALREVEAALFGARAVNRALENALTRLAREYAGHPQGTWTAAAREQLKLMFAAGNDERRVLTQTTGLLGQHTETFRSTPPERRDGVMLADIRELSDSAANHTGEATALGRALEKVADLLSRSRVEKGAPPDGDELSAVFDREYGQSMTE